MFQGSWAARLGYIIGVLAIVAISGAIAIGYISNARDVTPIEVVETKKSTSAVSNKSQSSLVLPVSMNFVGDVMLDRTVWDKMQKSGLSFPFDKITTWLKDGDLTLANLEGPVTNLGIHSTVTGPLIFKFEPKVIETLANAGINVVSLANNHTYNQGTKGLEDTRSNLRLRGISYFGDPRNISEFSFLGQKLGNQIIGFIGYNEIDSGGNHERELIDLIGKVRDQVDFLVVSPHWGAEYKAQTEHQVTLSHEIIDAGVDLIVGTHPHIVQGIELYQDKPIIYSLGNFIFDQYWSEPTQEGLAIKVKLSEFELNIDLIPLDLHKSQPKIAGDKIRDNVIERLIDSSDVELHKMIKSLKITTPFKS